MQTDLGEWTAYETPGHAPSHVCLFQPERRLLISGDHLLGRISLYFEYGYSPDPVGEFLRSLDVVQRLGARLCLAGHGRTFTDVHAHIEGNRELVHERLDERARRRSTDGPLTAFEIVPRVLRRRALGAERAVAAVGDARLPRRTCEALGRRDGASPASPSAGRVHNRQMRIDEILAAEAPDRSPSSSFRRRPRRASRTCTRRSPSCEPLDAVVRVGHLRRGRLHARARRSRSSSAIKERVRPGGDGALHLRGRHRARSCAPRSTRCASAGIDNVLALRGDPPAGQEDWTKTEGGLEYSRELVELIARRLPVRDRRGVLPRDAHPRRRAPRTTCATSARRWARACDFLITQLFFDNNFYFDFVARARAAGIERADHPGHHADHAGGSGGADGDDVRLGDPRRPARASCTRASEDAEAVLDFGVAYATLQCAELLAAGAPGIHFYTLNRSPATRAILSALKLARPWEKARLPGLDLQRPRPRAASRRRPRSARRPSRSGGRCHAPRAEQPAPAADLVLAQVLLEHQRAFAHGVVRAELLAARR